MAPFKSAAFAQADGEVLFRHGAAASQLIVILDGAVDAREPSRAKQKAATFGMRFRCLKQVTHPTGPGSHSRRATVS